MNDEVAHSQKKKKMKSHITWSASLENRNHPKDPPSRKRKRNRKGFTLPSICPKTTSPPTLQAKPIEHLQIKIQESA